MSNFLLLDNLIKVYFSQDYHYFADTMEGLVEEFVRSGPPDDISALRAEIARFLAQDDMEEMFQREYGFDVDPKLWDHTTVSFLKKIDELLAQHQQEKRG